MTTVTSKGQVTIPKRVRDATGLRPGAKVSVEYRDGGALIIPERKAGKISKSDFMKRIEKVRGTLKLGMSTDEYMKMMRGDD
ncbi:MAG TPA: AbrB/MazE/SpoVT family DNA-binding domain-containing protein [Rhizomicrobium sp.]